MYDLSEIIQRTEPLLVNGGVSFALAMALTPVYTYFAFKYKAWKQTRELTTDGKRAQLLEELQGEKHKRNIPTMAGIIVIVAVAMTTLLLNYSRSQTLLPLVATVGAGFIGLIDDLINLRSFGKGVAGLAARFKFGLILLVSVLGAYFFYFKLGYSTLAVPFYGSLTIGWLIIPLFIAVFVSTANAVNITDGLDGLAGGLLITTFFAYAVIAFFQGNIGISAFCMSMVGGLLAYTWFNIYPARFFMGDVGSFAFGAALGVVAMMTDTVFLLPIIGLIFVVEAGSSLLQVASAKLLGKRIFLAAPIHYYFQAKGWPETKVTMRFWILGQLFAGLGLIIGIAGGLI